MIVECRRLLGSWPETGFAEIAPAVSPLQLRDGTIRRLALAVLRQEYLVWQRPSARSCVAPVSVRTDSAERFPFSVTFSRCQEGFANHK